MKTILKLLPAVLVLLAGPISLFATPTEDRQIEAAAAASYNYHTVLDDKVKAKVDNGVVTLTGTVRDQHEKRLAADTIDGIAGVTSVRNDIVVKSEHAENSDAWMALKIRSLLLVKANVSATATSVDVKDGIVTLSGKAENLAQKELTAAYAKDIEGVKSVKNDLVVEAAVPASKDGAVARAGSDNERADAKRTAGEVIDDASITAQVKSALFSHKSTSALKTKIDTKVGVVSITGVASSDAEKSLVTKLAQDVRGTVSVKNDMTVTKI